MDKNPNQEIHTPPSNSEHFEKTSVYVLKTPIELNIHIPDENDMAEKGALKKYLGITDPSVAFAEIDTGRRSYGLFRIDVHEDNQIQTVVMLVPEGQGPEQVKHEAVALYPGEHCEIDGGVIVKLSQDDRLTVYNEYKDQQSRRLNPVVTGYPMYTAPNWEAVHAKDDPEVGYIGSNSPLSW